MRAINLIPKQAVAQQGAGLGGKLPLIGAAAVPVIALIFVFVGYSSGHSSVSSKQAQLAAINAQIAAATAPAASVAAAAPAVNTAGLVSERSARLAALQLVLADEVPWDTTLLDVARVLPAGVWLTSLSVTSPTPADALAPIPVVATTTTTTAGTPAPAVVAPAAVTTGVTIAGDAYTTADVAAALQRLQLLPTLANITLVSTSTEPVGDTTLTEFNITASLQLPSTTSQS
jgi:Tfp pilus assembly protein PilN